MSPSGAMIFGAGVVSVAAGAPAGVPAALLNNGVRMPKVAFAAQLWDPDTCESATKSAFAAGFRFIWSSALIGNDCQAAQAKAIKASGIARQELFIGGTANTQGCSSEDDCYQQTKTAAEGQFAVLGEAVLDMLMLDYPASDDCDSINGQWRAFEEFYAAKKTRTIAVSNFDLKQLACLHGKTVPVVNQMSYSVGHGSDSVVADDEKLGVVVQAYSPLGSGGLATDPLCVSIGKAHSKSGAQVALRWIIQRNATIATQSTNEDHLKADLDIFDFELTDDEMAKLNAHSSYAASLHV